LNINYKLTQKGIIQWRVLQNSRLILEGSTESDQAQDEFSLVVSDPEVWSPDSPSLYKFEAQIADCEAGYSTKFGIRTIEVRQSGIYLNNNLIRIRGVSMHEELMPYGRTIPEKERLKDLRMMKKLGFNTLRTAHYSHDERLIALADEVGILILEEIPVYWFCDFKNPKVLKLALSMIKGLISRDFNHPSVILWSCGNEINVEHRACYRFMHQLMQSAKKLDSSRIITYVSSRMFSDQLRSKSDLPCLNTYFGWYYFSERNLNRVLDFIHQTAPTQPLLITEFGADAKHGFHSKELQKFSEEKQASILSESIRTFNSKDYIAGWIIWIYRDFRSPMRMNQYQQGFNRKGIVSDKNESKLIIKVIRNLLWEKPQKRRIRLLARYYFLLKPLELLVFGIFYELFQNLLLKKKFEKHYSRKSLDSKQ
jgi:beta-glucuronidase